MMLGRFVDYVRGVSRWCQGGLWMLSGERVSGWCEGRGLVDG